MKNSDKYLTLNQIFDTLKVGDIILDRLYNKYEILDKKIESKLIARGFFHDKYGKVKTIKALDVYGKIYETFDTDGRSLGRAPRCSSSR